VDFKKFTGERVEDVASYIKDYIEDHKGEFVIMVGCDSLPHGLRKRKATFTEVVCLHQKVDGIGKGAHILYKREHKVRVFNTRDRLMKEADRLVKVCQELRESGIEAHERVLYMEPQLDFNKKNGEESNKYLDEARGYVKAFDFDVEVKPDAPAASYAADHCCRGKEK